VLVNNGFVAGGGIGRFTRQVFTRTAVDQLPTHLEQEYGIEVAGVTELDAGVYRLGALLGRLHAGCGRWVSCCGPPGPGT
jgi:hypothetical protein